MSDFYHHWSVFNLSHLVGLPYLCTVKLIKKQMEMLTDSSILIPNAGAIQKRRTLVNMNYVLADEEAVIKVLQQYKESINSADAEAGSMIWSMNPEVSMIHPSGHERGWIKSGSMFTGNSIEISSFGT
ncbi:MAG: hypothetical protein ACKOCH_25130 [Bacteroidota bacterium]